MNPIRDAQAVWKGLSDYQMSSTAGALHRDQLLAYLTTFKLDSMSWKGTHASFLSHWKNQMREFERLTKDPRDHFSGEMKLTLLMNAVSLIPSLDSIKSTLHLEVAQGRPMPSFDDYVTLLESTCVDLDSRHAKGTLKLKTPSSPLTAQHP